MNAPVRNSHFHELGHALGWHTGTRVMTLWAYFDESGWHPGGGALAKLTVGGCISSFEEWDRLEGYWADAIAEMGIDCFHMTDFEARVPPYDKWTEAERKKRLNTLLNIIGQIKPACWGFTNYARPGESSRSIYERCAHDVLLELGLYDEQFAIVFAHHPEYGEHNELVGLLQKHGMGKAIKSLAIAKPIDACALQAADVIAYEFRCLEREELRPMRYPLKRLHELGCPFRSSSEAG
ncbi:MAG: hypothetical protein WCA56_17615 [Xanthobacteraceae bacterium]